MVPSQLRAVSLLPSRAKHPDQEAVIPGDPTTTDHRLDQQRGLQPGRNNATGQERKPMAVARVA